MGKTLATIPPHSDLPPQRWSVDLPAGLLLACLFLGSFVADPALAQPANDGAWSLLPGVFDSPENRLFHGSVLDPVNRRVIIFGGSDQRDEILFDDTWALSLDNPDLWRPMAAGGPTPEPRKQFLMVYDSTRERAILFGGWLGDRTANDVWELDLDGVPTWNRITPQGTPPPPRFSHAGIYDPVRDRVVVFGGNDGFNFLNDTWELTLSGNPEWKQIIPSGPVPSRRFGHTAIYDPIGDELIVFAGLEGTDFGGFTFTPLNDVWSLSLGSNPTWMEWNIPDPHPDTRRYHTAIYADVGHRMVIWSGERPDGTFPAERVWALELGGLRFGWTSHRSGADPAVSYQSASTMTPKTKWS